MNSMQDAAQPVFSLLKANRRRVLLPFVTSRVSAGFPSPADDYLDRVIDLNDLCIEQPAATFFVRAGGKSMTGGVADIHDGDILLVNRAIKPKSGHIVIACLEGEFCVKRLHLKGATAWLEADNEAFPAILVNPEIGVMIFGVVRTIVRLLR